jgi:hypothetical protein
MIVVRDVFQAKYGKGGELVGLLKESLPEMARGYQRILSDASGPFFTIITEIEVANLADWENLMAEVFTNPKFSQWFERMVPLVESGRREFYNVE